MSAEDEKLRGEAARDAVRGDGFDDVPAGGRRDGRVAAAGRVCGKDSAVRRANAVLAAALTVLFLGHEALGSLSVAVDISRTMEWFVWVGVAGMIVHVLLCVATSYWMMTDQVRPPSRHKRNHLVLKWASGAVLAALAAAHALTGGVAAPSADGAASSVLAVLSSEAAVGLAVVLAAALAWHAFVGVKSALRDLGVARRCRVGVRALLVIVTVVVAVVCVAASGCMASL